MREIKFRAWDSKQMIAPTDVSTVLWEDLVDDSTQITINDINGIIADNRRVFMQYTGLLDRNGVEIYEGDIVRVDKPDSIKGNKAFRGSVVWHNAQFFLLDKPPIWWNLSYFYPKHGWDEDWYKNETIQSTKIEIIGNIYENPELLK